MTVGDGSSPQFDSAWRRRVAACERFEEQWQARRGGGEALKEGVADGPPVVDFLGDSTGDERLRLLLELLRIDLEYRWKAGERRGVERYGDEHPELIRAGGLPVELIVDEWCLRAERGEEGDDDDWELRFPGRRAALLVERARRRPTRVGRTDDERSGGSESFGAEDDRPADGAAGESRDGATHIGRYELRGCLGRGGFATVHLAWDSSLRREVALKQPHPHLWEGGERDERLEREARSAARLRHPAIVPIHEVGLHAGLPFIVYERLPGPTLAERLRDTRPAPAQAAEWVERLAEALDYAHQRGIVHRDVKPANILFDGNGRPALIDFGLARDEQSPATLTRHGDILGTPAYMSPEQAAGRGHEVDGRSDVYSLGVVLYELLCGRPPFQGGGAGVLQAVASDEPSRPSTWRPGIPPDLEIVCLKALAKEPRRRYQTAGALAADLRAWLEDRPITARRTGPVGRLLRWSRRNPALAATLIVALGALVVTAGFGYWRVSRERDRYWRERETAVANLYASLEREARALRLARRSGYRESAWDRLREAGRLETPQRDSEALRQEALASLGDFVGRAPRRWDRPADLEGWTSAVCSHPNRPWVAVAYTDAIVILDRTSGEVLDRLDAHDAGVYALTFSADGSSLVSMDDQGRLLLHRRSTADGRWRLVREMKGEASAERHLVVAVSCGLSPDGRHAFASAKGEPRVRRWNLETGVADAEYRGDAGELFVRSVLSPDGDLLVGADRAADVDGIVVWDVAERKVVRKLPISRQGIVDVAFSPDGAYLACACVEGVYVLDTTAWERRTVVRADDQFYTVAFHPTRPLLAVPSRVEGRVRLWDVQANREEANLEHPGGPHTVAFTPDGGALLAAGDHRLYVWDLIGGGEKRAVAGHQGVVNDVRFSPDGRFFATAGADTRVCLWDARELRRLSRLETDPSPLAKAQRVAFHPDGKSLAVVDWHGGATVHDVSNPTQPRVATRLLAPDAPLLGSLLFDVRFSPDGTGVVAAGANGVRWWPGGAEPRTLASDAATTVRFSPDGRQLIVRRRLEGRLSRIELATAVEHPVPDSIRSTGTFQVEAGRLLTCEGRHGSSGPPQFRWTDWTGGGSSEIVWSSWPASVGELEFGAEFVLSAAGDRAVLRGKQVTIWDLRRGRLSYVLPSEGAPINAFDLSPDGVLLACGLSDGGVVLWNLVEVDRLLESLDLPH